MWIYWFVHCFIRLKYNTFYTITIWNFLSSCVLLLCNFNSVLVLSIIICTGTMYWWYSTMYVGRNTRASLLTKRFSLLERYVAATLFKKDTVTRSYYSLWKTLTLHSPSKHPSVVHRCSWISSRYITVSNYVAIIANPWI